MNESKPQYILYSLLIAFMLKMVYKTRFRERSV
jgi:hypothetical protein